MGNGGPKRSLGKQTHPEPLSRNSERCIVRAQAHCISCTLGEALYGLTVIFITDQELPISLYPNTFEVIREPFLNRDAIFGSNRPCSRLGQGGFGQVYACRRRKSGQILAAKFIPLSEASLIEGNPYVERECKMADLQHVGLLECKLYTIMLNFYFPKENIVSVFEILNDPIGVCE